MAASERILYQPYVLGKRGNLTPGKPLLCRNAVKGGQSLSGSVTRPFIAVLLPGPAFFAIGRPRTGLVCLALQLSVIGWIPAGVWAASAVPRLQASRERQRALAARLRPG